MIKVLIFILLLWCIFGDDDDDNNGSDNLTPTLKGSSGYHWVG